MDERLETHRDDWKGIAIADRPGDFDTGDDTNVGADRASTAGMPRWVKVSLIIGLALVLLFLVGKVTGLGGEHGPGRHGAGAETRSSVLDEDGVTWSPIDQGA